VNGTNAEDGGLNITQRFQFIEFEIAGLSRVRKPRRPQLLKSHMPYNCLPAGVEAGHGKVKAFECQKMYKYLLS